MWDQIVEFVSAQLKRNDLLAGGAMLAAAGIVLNYLRRIPFTLIRWSRWLFVTDLDIPDKTDAFLWVNEWVADHSYMKKARRITVSEKREQAQFAPAPGWHFLWWHRRPIILVRIRNESTGDNAARSYRESWSISILGSSKRANEFIEECRRASHKEKDDFIKVRESEDGYWECSSKRRKRSLESVILPLNVKETLVNDIRKFIDDKHWYEEMCIPWRRGYLLYGTPGNGKSSLITAIASEFNLEVCICQLRSTREEDLSTLMRTLPKNCLLLLEDIDCVFDDRKSEGKVSLSNLLNQLDGVNASEGRLLFMTTNRPATLDSALIRPGRVDMTIKLDNPTMFQIEQMFLRFFPKSKEPEAFAKRAIQYKPTMAQVQGYLLRHKGSMREAKDCVKELGDAQIQDHQ